MTLSMKRTMQWLVGCQELLNVLLAMTIMTMGGRSESAVEKNSADAMSVIKGRKLL